MGNTSQCDQYADQILLLNSQGVQRKDIAAQLGLTTAQVQAWLKRRGVVSPTGRGKRPMLDPTALQTLLSQGRTHQQIAEQLGCSLSCVERTAARLRLQTARTGPRAGSGHPHYKGGRRLDKHGYVQVHVPLHPAATKSGYVYEHRLMMEVIQGRYLSASEVVDHQDNHPRHNWPSNLALYSSNAAHLSATLTGRTKQTPRSSIPGAYGNNQKIHHCPAQHETQAQCPEQIRRLFARHVHIHQPTTAHLHLSRSAILRMGATDHPVFVQTSTATNTCFPP